MRRQVWFTAPNDSELEPGTGLAESNEYVSEIYSDAARHTGWNDIGRGCVGSGVWWEWVEHPYAITSADELHGRILYKRPNGSLSPDRDPPGVTIN